MVEPLEETRSELVFATEPLLSSLHDAIPESSYFLGLVELDEVEVGILLHFVATEEMLKCVLL